MNKVLCFIPARGGSARVPRKNIRMFHGKPIIHYSIENALKCGLFDTVLVSTDDDEIDRLSRKAGAMVARRPKCDGTMGTQELAGEYLRGHPEYGMCCVLYATSPLLEWWHLIAGWQALGSSMYAHATHVHTKEDIGGFYWGYAQAFREGIPLLAHSKHIGIPPERCCDINTEDDLSRAERMYGALHE